jgi:hypothetical protein
LFTIKQKFYNHIQTGGFEMTEKVNTVLIASGSGTDADSIMKAYASGFIVLPNEWMMLPTAVRMAAKKIIDSKEVMA